jgi:hypothetical protein
MKGGQMDSLKSSMGQIFGEAWLQVDLPNGIMETRQGLISFLASQGGVVSNLQL